MLAYRLPAERPVPRAHLVEPRPHPAVGRFGPFVALSVAASGAPPESAGLGDVDLLAQGLAIRALSPGPARSGPTEGR